MTDQKEATESLFVVKGKNEYCFLYSEEAPREIYKALLDCADEGQSGLGTDEALEVIEDLLTASLRRL